MDRTIILGLANAPVGSGRVLEQALVMAGKGWSWFLGWVVRPGNLQRLLSALGDVATLPLPQAVQAIEELFRADH